MDATYMPPQLPNPKDVYRTQAVITDGTSFSYTPGPVVEAQAKVIEEIARSIEKLTNVYVDMNSEFTIDGYVEALAALREMHREIVGGGK